ncbi:MAG: hypothetical protein WAV30_03715 [Microgenomates group bacterium]
MEARGVETFKRTEANEKKCIEAMRSVVKRGSLFGTSSVIFNTLFPETAPVEIYKHEALGQHPTTKYSPEEKLIAELALNELGLISDKPEKRKDVQISPYDEPEHHIAYVPKKSAYLNRLNELPILNDMSGVTMVEAMPHVGQDNERKKTDRKKHSKILGAAITRDIVRMAIKTPELFLKLAKKDVERLQNIDPKIKDDVLSGKYTSNSFVSEIHKLRESGIVVTDQTFEALTVALEYAKYITLFAYLHDSQTPALADIIMKAKKRFVGQESIDFSEDVELRKNIHSIVYGSKIESIGQIFNNFHLSKRFFVAEVMSMCQENDNTLGGMLIKNKRKKGYIEKGGSSELAGKAAFDRDQVAGTRTNIEDRANLYLPGGFQHSYKKDAEWRTPIGSFTERLQLLAYAMARNLGKEDLEAELRKELSKQGFKKKHIQDDILKNVAIMAEEFEYGPNFTLRELPTGEIVPVALDPGALKRLLSAFATLTYFHYQGDQRSAYESLIQDIITSIHAYQKEFRVSSPSANSQMTNILSTFIERSDRGAVAMLAKDYPILKHIIESYLSKGMRVTEKELPALLDSINSEGNFALISRASFFPVDQKNGTLVEDELDINRTPTPYLEIIRHKKNGKKRDMNPNSLPNRLDALATLTNEKLFYVIKLTHTDVTRLKRQLKQTPTAAYRDITTRALRYWMMDIPVNGQIITNALAEQFPLLGEHAAPTMAHSIEDDLRLGADLSKLIIMNLYYLKEAQQRALQTVGA